MFFVLFFLILYYMYCFWDGFWHYLRAWCKLRACVFARFFVNFQRTSPGVREKHQKLLFYPNFQGLFLHFLELHRHCRYLIHRANHAVSNVRYTAALGCFGCDIARSFLRLVVRIFSSVSVQALAFFFFQTSLAAGIRSVLRLKYASGLCM